MLLMRSTKNLIITVQIFVFCWCQTSYKTGSAFAQTVRVRPTKPPQPKDFGELLNKNKRVNNAVKLLPATVQERLKSGGSGAFKNMSLDDLKKLPPSAVAYMGKEAIRGMDKAQMKEMTKQFSKTSTQDLKKILESVDSTQLDDILDEFKNGSEKLSLSQRDTFIDHMKHSKGNDPSKWTKEDVTKLGSLVTGFSPGDLKKLGSNKENFEASLDQLKLGSSKMSEGQKLAVIRGAEEAFGDPGSWDATKLRKVSSFVQKLPAKQINKLPVGAVRDVVEDLGKEKWEPTRAREMLDKLKDQSHGFGDPKTWSADTVKKLGSLSSGFTPKDIKSLPDDTVKGALTELAENAAGSKQKANELSKRMKEIYGSVSTWTPDTVRDAKHILKGLKPKDLKDLPASVVASSMNNLKEVNFTKLQARELAEKVKLQYGNPRTWSRTIVADMGAVMKGLRLSELQDLDTSVIDVAMETMAKDDTVPASKKRVILKKVKEAGVPIVKAGYLVEEFSLDDLGSINVESDLGLSTDPADNDTDDVSRESLKWRKSQARLLLIKLKTKWGLPEDSGSQWTLSNIRRLHRILNGVWKEFILALPVDGFEDVVEFVSRYRGEWSPAQGKAIAEAIRIKLDFQSPEDFASFTEVLAGVLGPFVSDLEADELRAVKGDAIPETVRQLGSSMLEKVPKAIVKSKTQLALEMLGKGRSADKGPLKPSELTAEELQDIGKLVCGLEPRELRSLDRTHVKASIVTIADSAKLCDNDQLAALASTVKDSYVKEDSIAGVEAFTDNHFRNMGIIAAGLTEDDFRRLDRSLIKRNLDILSEMDLSKRKASVVAAAAVETVTAKRRRRATTDLSTKTADDLIEMGSALAGFSASELATVSTTAFSGAVGDIGTIKTFNLDQLKVWADLAKESWSSDVSTFTSDQLQSLGVIAVGFSAANLGSMNLAADDDIESLGSVDGYTTDQLNSAWAQIKKKKNKAISSFTGDEISALKNFAVALTPTEVGQITTTTYKSSAATLGGLKGWTNEQMAKLKERAVAAFGAVSQWSAAQLTDAGAAIGGFTSAEIEALTSVQIEVISTGAISQISPNLFKAFSVSQLKLFDYNQAAAVTSAQRDALSLEKQNVLLSTEGRDKVTSDAGRPGNRTAWSSAGTLLISFFFFFL